MAVLRWAAVVLALATPATADPLAFVPLTTPEQPEPQPPLTPAKEGFAARAVPAAPSRAAPTTGSVLAVSVEPYWRWPSQWSEGVLEYPDKTSGTLFDIALRLPSYRQLYYHVSAGSLELDGGDYRGYLIAPVQLGYWFPVLPRYPVRIDAGVVGTLVQLEYMAGTSAPAYSTQSSLALAWGLTGYIGVGLDAGPFGITLGIGAGIDSRYASFQRAGVTGETADGLAWTWVLRPSVGLRLGEL